MKKIPYNPHLDRPVRIPFYPRKPLVRRLSEAQEKSGLDGNKKNIPTRN